MKRIRGSIALVALALLALLGLACGGGGGGSSPTSPAPMAVVVTVTVKDFTYAPKDVVINPGDTVQWVLAPGSMLVHTVTDANGAFDSGFLNAPSASFSRTFDNSTSGLTFNYHCKTHFVSNGMAGSIRVGQAAPPPRPGY
ncbi:MAG TPA: plastocyanin/azurin family copper-binding protein [Thermoanaerobaculia bacterium]|nr:plastocyanin/azurin family copper-binding protein [Thermoanaerobaculia bacterium]